MRGDECDCRAGSGVRVSSEAYFQRYEYVNIDAWASSRSLSLIPPARRRRPSAPGGRTLKQAASRLPKAS